MAGSFGHNSLLDRGRRLIKESFLLSKEFGFGYSASYFFHKTICRGAMYKTRLKAINLLRKEFTYVLGKYVDKNAGVYSPNLERNIFVFWYDGFEKAPAFIIENIKLMQFFFPDYKLFKLDKNNYKEFAQLDSNLICLFEKGNISIQTFSDILRFYLLGKYGGFWIDATIRFFQREELMERLEKNGFYSLNCEFPLKHITWDQVIPNMKYSTFFLGSIKNNPIMNAAYELYVNYYSKHSIAIDYLMTDYFLLLIREKKLGQDALNNVEPHSGSPIYLLECLQKKRAPLLSECVKCPQKLNWRIKECNEKFDIVKDI